MLNIDKYSHDMYRTTNTQTTGTEHEDTIVKSISFLSRFDTVQLLCNFSTAHITEWEPTEYNIPCECVRRNIHVWGLIGMFTKSNHYFHQLNPGSVCMFTQTHMIASKPGGGRYGYADSYAASPHDYIDGRTRCAFVCCVLACVGSDITVMTTHTHNHIVLMIGLTYAINRPYHIDDDDDEGGTVHMDLVYHTIERSFPEWEKIHMQTHKTIH